MYLIINKKNLLKILKNLLQSLLNLPKKEVKYYSIRTLKIILLITILLVVLGKIASLSDEEMFKDIEEYYHSFVGIIISVFLLVVFRPRYPMGIFSREDTSFVFWAAILLLILNITNIIGEIKKNK